MGRGGYAPRSSDSIRTMATATAPSAVLGVAVACPASTARAAASASIGLDAAADRLA